MSGPKFPLNEREWYTLAIDGMANQQFPFTKWLNNTAKMPGKEIERRNTKYSTWLSQLPAEEQERLWARFLIEKEN